MRLLLYSPAFHPAVGGLETVVSLLAEGFARRGHQVVVVCLTRSPEPDRAAYRVVRRPKARELFALTRWCEVFFQANVSLKGLWPLALAPRPWVVSHHSWYRGGDGRRGLRDRLKRRLLSRAALSIAVSEAMARDLATPPAASRSIVIGNPYRDDLFRRLPGIARDRDLVFVGRLVSDKGVDVLLAALGELARRGLRPGLTVIGGGPEEPRLREQAQGLGLVPRVRFAGTLAGEALVAELNRHRILVAPSRYHEPFGLVALEGIACGCAVVGTAGGGLPEAIGPCGVTVPNGDAGALADALAELAAAPERLAELQAAAAAHLAKHSADRVVDAYLEALRGVLERPTGKRS